jgi:hypothetical protein
MTDDAYHQGGRIPAVASSAAARLALKRAARRRRGVIRRLRPRRRADLLAGRSEPQHRADGVHAQFVRRPRRDARRSRHSSFGAAAPLAMAALLAAGALRVIAASSSRASTSAASAHASAASAACRRRNHDPNAGRLAARDWLRRPDRRLDRRHHRWPRFDAWLAVPARADRHRVRHRRLARHRLVVPSAR